MLESNLNAIDGRDAKPNDILGPAMSVPFLSAKRLVLVEHFLARFEQRGDQRQTRSTAAFEPLFAALAAGMAAPDPEELRYLHYKPGDIAAAAQRLAAEGG